MLEEANRKVGVDLYLLVYCVREICTFIFQLPLNCVYKGVVVNFYFFNIFCSLCYVSSNIFDVNLDCKYSIKKRRKT